MQLSAFLLFAVGLQVSAATYSQTVSFTGKDVPLKTVFASLKNQTGYGVFFENGEAMLQSSAPVTLDLKNVSLEVFLKVCLKDQPLDYTLEGKTIFIKKKETPPPASPTPPTAPPIAEIKGRVTNDKGEPLVNANITVKRTGHGTITDANGNFTLQNVSSEDVVMVSFIGYKTQAVPIQARSNLTLVMQAATNDLDKVVVQAYGTTSQRLATGNIGTVRAEDIEKQPVMNVLQAIQGQVPGVVVTNTNGYASSPIKIEIRGRNTISPSSTSDPLYIIDGVPLTVLDIAGNANYNNGSPGFIQNGFNGPSGGQSPFFSINPSDIESIEILKDGDATAIYGSRGANGVILISTKKGKAGKTHFDLNVYEGISSVPRHFKMLNTKQYVAMRREAFQNAGSTPDIYNAADLLVWDTTRYTDWQKYFWGGLGKVLDIQSSISGGDARTTFRIGTGYRSQADILAISGANKRGSISFNLTHKTLNEKFSASIFSTYTYSYIDQITAPSLVTLPPNAPSLWDKNGQLNYKGWTPLINYPLSALLSPYNSKTSFLNIGLTLNYELIKGINIKTDIGYNTIQVNQSNFTTIASQNPASNPTGSSAFGYNNIHNLNIEPQLTYNGFISKGKISILAGLSKQSNSTEGLQTAGYGYDNDALLHSISSAPNQGVYDNYGEYKYAAIFGRITYNWENKYIINLNARRDGSSRFGPGRQFGNFSSVAAAWLFSEENWFKEGLHFISFGKIRSSYGTTGFDGIGDYSFQTQWSSINNVLYSGIRPISPNGHSDSLLHWEVNKKLEVALDLGFLKDRITFEISYYRNRCNDQLVSFPTPGFTGFTSVTANSPANVQNKGWEFILNSEIIKSRDFTWSFKFNLGLNRNKLLSYPNLAQSPYASVFAIGQPLNINRLLHYTGVDPLTGLYTFEDKNKDGSISIDYSGQTIDDRYIYNLNPKFSGGITNNIGYKNWNLNFLFYFKKQIGVNAFLSAGIPGSIANQPIEILNHWQKAGDVAPFAKLTVNPYADPSYNNFQSYSDGLYTDASYFRLQNLSLSYSLSENILKKAGIEKLNIHLQGENLFILTKYKGVDPETQRFGGIPLLRTITAGISCNF